MTLTTNLIVALGFLFAIFVISQMIYLAMRMHHSMLLNRQRERQRRRLGIEIYSNLDLNRQNNVELGRQNNRYGDIFFIEPNSQEAARIREQLEKDEKDLPSYDEVMRMCNLTSPTPAAAPATSPLSSPTVETTTIGIAALPAPPYSEVDPLPAASCSAAATPATPTGNPPVALELEPSTSRAAQLQA